MSWKDKLVWIGSQETGAVLEEEFKLIDGDVMVEIVDGILLITFLERVHKHIEKRMASLWKPKKLIQLIDLENDYYKVKFQDEEDYSAALIGEPWIIFGQYLICLFKVIGEAIGSVYKIGHNTNSSTKGRFVRLTVCIDLGKPLVSKVKIDGKMQRIEYEYFSNVCFGCGRFGHNQDICPLKSRTTLSMGENPNQPLSKIEEI
ncbi:hypothetical protein Gotur_002532 [Gossypium turneri]